MRDVRVGHVIPSEHGQRVLDQALRRAVEEARGLVVHAGGGDVVGGDEQDVDAHVLGLVVEGAGEFVDEGLGGCVGGEERGGVIPGARRDVDNGARATVCVWIGVKKKKKGEHGGGLDRHVGGGGRLAAATDMLGEKKAKHAVKVEMSEKIAPRQV